MVGPSPCHGLVGTALRTLPPVAISDDATRHPELAIARWAASNLTPAERAEATVYTSGEDPVAPLPITAVAPGVVADGPEARFRP